MSCDSHVTDHMTWLFCIYSTKEELLPRFKAFVEKYDHVLKILLAKNPQMIFAHFHFLLESTELLSRFMHVVRTQVCEDHTHNVPHPFINATPLITSMCVQ